MDIFVFHKGKKFQYGHAGTSGTGGGQGSRFNTPSFSVFFSFVPALTRKRIPMSAHSGSVDPNATHHLRLAQFAPTQAGRWPAQCNLGLMSEHTTKLMMRDAR